VPQIDSTPPPSSSAVPDYLSVAFNAADSTDPKKPDVRLLCYNDYGAEGASSPKAAKVLTLINQLLTAGVPVNCVGLQMHIDVDQHPSGADVAANIKALGALGMTVHSACLAVQAGVGGRVGKRAQRGRSCGPRVRRLCVGVCVPCVCHPALESRSVCARSARPRM